MSKLDTTATALEDAKMLSEELKALETKLEERSRVQLAEKIQREKQCLTNQPKEQVSQFMQREGSGETTTNSEIVQSPTLDEDLRGERYKNDFKKD